MPMTADDILKLAEPWSAPISDAAPAGASAKEDERYANVTTEIARLDAPSMEKIDWKKLWSTVITDGGELLQEKSKDLLIASQVAYAMFRQDGLQGLLKGTALLTAIVENFWPTLFPELKRIKGRAAALQWFIDKSVISLGQVKPGPGDRDRLDSLLLIVKRLGSSSRDKFGDACPSFGKLREAVERMQLDAGPSQAELDAARAEEDARRAEEEKRKAEQAAAQQAAAQQAAAQQAAAQQAAQQAAAQQATAQQAAPPVVAPPVVVSAPVAPVVAPVAVPSGPPVTVAAPTATVSAPPADVSQVSQWLSGVGATISQTAGPVRRSADSAALAYRMTRIGLYAHLVDAPPADASGKTKVPPPQANTRKQIETIATNQKWSALIEETESSLSQSRFWLDLHRYTATALAGLGPSHAKAREEVVRELGVVLARLPALATLQFSDGTPFADAQTRQWIEAEVLAAGGGASQPAPASAPVGAAQVVVVQGGGGASEEAAVIQEAKKLAAAGKAQDALAMLQAKATSAPSAAARFRYRLGIGQVCVAVNPALAKGVFEGLERDVTTHGLEQWDPMLASATAEGLVQCYRALAKGGKAIPPETSVLYDRVCRLDPAAALRLGAQ